MSAFHHLLSWWKQKTNRRTYRRLSTSSPIWITDPQEERCILGRLTSFSLGGVSLQAPDSPPLGHEVIVRFELPGGFETEVNLTGRILRKSRKDLRIVFLGVEFTHFEEPDHARLREALLNPRREFEYLKSPFLDDPQVPEQPPRPPLLFR